MTRCDIVQVGAHLAQESQSAAENGAQCLFVEPIPELYSQLVQKFGHFPNVLLENVAVAARAGARPLYHLRDVEGLPYWADQIGSLDQNHIADLAQQSSFPPSYRDRVVTTMVKCTTLFELLEKHGIAQVEKLMVDTEGLDYEILADFDFSRLEIRRVVFERKHTDGVRKTGYRYNHLVDRLTQLGYRVSHLDHQNDEAALVLSFEELKQRALLYQEETMPEGWLRRLGAGSNGGALQPASWERGVVYLALGRKSYLEAQQSIGTLRQTNPGLPVTVFTDGSFAGGLPADYRTMKTDRSPFKLKIEAMTQSPYAQTLFLDTDTRVVGPLDGLFDFLANHDWCIAEAPSFHYDDGKFVFDAYRRNDVFNTGVIAFTMNEAARRVLHVWAAHMEPQLDDDIRAGYHCDQTYFNESVIADDAYRTLRTLVLDSRVWNARCYALGKIVRDGLLPQVRIIHARPWEVRQFWGMDLDEVVSNRLRANPPRAQRVAATSVKPNCKLVFCNGMPRSASTWSFNVCRRLLQELYPQDTLYSGYHENLAETLASLGDRYDHLVLKCHGLDDKGRELCASGQALAVYTHRDPYDAIYSSMVMFKQSFDEALELIRNSLGLWEFHRRNLTSYVIPYDRVRNAPVEAIAAIARHLHLEAPDELVQRIARETSPEAIAAIAAQVSEERGAVRTARSMYDPETHVHRNHIRNGASGYGREMLSEEQKERVMQVLAAEAHRAEVTPEPPTPHPAPVVQTVYPSPRLSENVLKQELNQPLYELLQPFIDAAPGPIGSLRRYRLAHIVSPYVCSAGSKNAAVQKTTFIAMARARNFGADRADVDLIAVPDGPAAYVPDFFKKTAALTRTVQDVHHFGVPRNLSLLFDILETGMAAANGAEFIIFTNADICPMPNFYGAVAALLSLGFDCLTINRRTTGTFPMDPRWSDLVPADYGTSHVGFDCFVFPIKFASLFVRSNSCVGAGYVMRSLLYNLAAFSRNMLMLTTAHLTYHNGDDKFSEVPELSDYVTFNQQNAVEVLKVLIKDPIAQRRLRDFCLNHDPINDAALFRRSVAPLGASFPRPPGSEADASDVEQVVQAYRVRYGFEHIADIHPADEIFNVLYQNSGKPSLAKTVQLYLESGEGLYNDLDAVFRDIGYSWERIEQFLDFACGYGRLTRFLASKLGPGRVTAADITPSMVDFVTARFGVHGFYSSGDPGQIRHAATYDAIYVVSFFSHLPLRTWPDFLGTLYQLLNPGGVLIFSTQGPRAYEVNNRRGWIPKDLVAEVEGFQYSGANETAGRLDGASYGTTYVSEAFVRQVVADRGYGRLLTYMPARIGVLQDAYAIRR